MADKGGIVYILFQLARVAFTQGDLTRSRDLADECLALSREVGHKVGISVALFHLARLAFATGDCAKARPLAEECLALCRDEMQDKVGTAYALSLLGQLDLYQGDAVTAYSRIEESLRLFQEEVKDRLGLSEAPFYLARVTAYQNDPTRARTLYLESYQMASAMSNKLLIASCLEGLACLAATEGESIWGAHLWGAAESLREVIGAPLLPIERDDYARSVAAARIQSGDKAFAAAWMEGRAMSSERALAILGQETMPKGVSAGQPTALLAKSPPTYPEGLTAREVEVLRLVAQGLTNEQVAEQLVISARTVNTHLTSIYGKIGVSSRSAATRYAMVHHLI